MKSFESFHTPRTIIRRLLPGDKQLLIELLCNKSVTQNMAFPDEMLTQEGISNLLEMTINAYDSEQPMLSFAIIDHDNAFMGITGFSPLQNKEIEVFYAFLPSYWGKGLATEILKSLTEYVFTRTDYKTIVAPITQNNTASIKVAEKNGFVKDGPIEHPGYKDLIFIYRKHKK